MFFERYPNQNDPKLILTSAFIWSIVIPSFPLISHLLLKLLFGNSFSILGICNFDLGRRDNKFNPCLCLYMVYLHIVYLHMVFLHMVYTPCFWYFIQLIVWNPNLNARPTARPTNNISHSNKSHVIMAIPRQMHSLAEKASVNFNFNSLLLIVFFTILQNKSVYKVKQL